jgi:hypothetical protein
MVVLISLIFLGMFSSVHPEDENTHACTIADYYPLMLGGVFVYELYQQERLIGRTRIRVKEAHDWDGKRVLKKVHYYSPRVSTGWKRVGVRYVVYYGNELRSYGNVVSDSAFYLVPLKEPLREGNAWCGGRIRDQCVEDNLRIVDTKANVFITDSLGEADGEFRNCLKVVNSEGGYFIFAPGVGLVEQKMLFQDKWYLFRLVSLTTE